MTGERGISMNGKFLGKIWAAGILFCFSACMAAPVTPTQTPLSVSAPAQKQEQASALAMSELKAPVSEQATALPPEGDIFEELLAVLPESGVISVTDANGTTFQVDASDENVGKMWDLLISSHFDPLEISDELFQGTYNSIDFSFSRDKNKYLIRLYGCGENHPVYPGRTVIDLESHGDGDSSFYSYIGSISVFQEVSRLAERLRGTLRLVFSEPFVKLETGSLEGERLTAWLEMGNRFLCAFTDGEGSSRIMTFDSKTGALLGTAREDETIRRMEPSRDESGFDYQAFTDTRILYRNSRSPLEEKPFSLPASIQPEPGMENKGNFDRKAEKLLWAENDGVHLAEADGSNEEVILKNEELAPLAGPFAPEGELRAAAPRLLGSEGLQVVVPAVTGEELAGIVLVNLEEGTKTAYFDVFGTGWKWLSYPDRRHVAAAGEQDVTVIEASSGDSKRLPFPHSQETQWYSNDFSTFLVSEKQENVLFQGYLVSARKPEDRSRPFLTVEGRGTFEIAGTSKRYIFAYADDSEGPRYLLIPY